MSLWVVERDRRTEEDECLKERQTSTKLKSWKEIAERMITENQREREMKDKEREMKDKEIEKWKTQREREKVTTD